MESLIVDGEYPYRLVVDPVLLLVALNATAKWTRLRALFLHQRILDEASGTLKDDIYQIIRDNTEDAVTAYGPSVYTEIALIYQYYHDEKMAEEMLCLSAEKIGFTFTLTGALGRRTKFQTFETTQLTVESSMVKSGEASTSAMPTEIALNDDVMLEKTALTNTLTSGDLDNNALAILLVQSRQLTLFHAKESVITEKALAYVNKVLEKPNCWCIYSTGLFMRSQLESTMTRKMERATLQIQALVDQIALPEPSFKERFALFFASPMPSPWEMDCAQGYLFASLGAFKTALTIFNRRELWDEAISCLVQIGDVAGAEERIAVEMERMPENPKLWCIKGDLHDDVGCFEKAWELSKGKFSRAQRSIGKYYFKKQDWTKAVEAFELALGINPLFSKTWFLLGCASIQIDDTKKALQAFGRVVTLEPGNGEAWNNIASIYLHEERHKDALEALKEASRLHRDTWKIQDNLFEVALTCGELLVATNALRRVAELNGDDFDMRKFQRLVGLLSRAVQFVGLKEFEMQSVRKRCLSLADEVLTAKHSANPDLWSTLARLAEIFSDSVEAKKCLFKAYRAAKALPFASNITIFTKLVSIISHLAELIRLDKIEDELFQLDMMLQSVKSAVSYADSEPAMQELAVLIKTQ